MEEKMMIIIIIIIVLNNNNKCVCLRQSGRSEDLYDDHNELKVIYYIIYEWYYYE